MSKKRFGNILFGTSFIFVGTLVISLPVLAIIDQSNQKKINEQNIFAKQNVEKKNNVQDMKKQYLEWGLNKEDWDKYLEIKEGERKYWSPNLDPLTMLGVTTDDPNERMRYARLLAQKEHDRVAKEFEFQRAYDKAFKELYPHEEMFDMNKVKLNNKLQHKNGQVRLIYFTKVNCGSSCDEDFAKFQNYAGNRPIDIFFVGKQTDRDIRQWATKQHIDVNKVRQHKITLNYDKGAWLKRGAKKIPVAYEVVGNKYKHVIY